MSVRKAFIWSFAGQLLSFAASFGTTVALTHILSPREIGIYAVGLAVVGVLQAISAFGVGTYIVREHDLAPATIATAFTINAAIGVALSAIVFGASFWPAVTTGEPMVGEVLRLLAIVPLLGAFEFRPATMLQREMNFRVISIITIMRTVIGALVSVAAALLGASSLSAAYGGVAYAMVGLIGFTSAARHHAVLSLSSVGWRPMVSFGLKTLSVGGLSMMTMRLSDIVLGRILGLTALGYFSRASALSNVIFQNIYGSAARVLFAKMADDDRAGIGVRTAYLRGLDIILALMWPTLAGVAVLANPAVAFLFGTRWLPTALPLALLMLGQGIALSFAMNHELFVLRDKVGAQTRLEAIRSVIGIAAFAYGCTYGLAGAATGRVVDGIVGAIIYVPMLATLSGAGRRELAAVYARALALTAAAVGPAAGLMWWANWSYDVSRLLICAAVLAGILLWAGLLQAIAHPLGAEATRMIGHLVARRRPQSR